MADPITLHSGEYGKVLIAGSGLREAHQWNVAEKTLTKADVHFFGDGNYAYTSGGVKRSASGTVTLLRNFLNNSLPVRSGDIIALELKETSTATQGWYFPEARVGDISEAVNGDSGDPIGWSFPFNSHGPYYAPGETRPS